MGLGQALIAFVFSLSVVLNSAPELVLEIFLFCVCIAASGFLRSGFFSLLIFFSPPRPAYGAQVACYHPSVQSLCLVYPEF